MANPSVPETGRKTEWMLTQKAFSGLLHWLDGGADSGGQSYMEIRRRLVAYFDRKNCPSPEELADETLNRVARRLEEEGSITGDTPLRYCYIVARFVLLEFLRSQKRIEPLDDEAPAAVHSAEERLELERRSESLERCLRNLGAEDLALIVGYYQGELRVKIENRRTMAASLGITMNALSIRACRIRDKLETCMRKLLNGTTERLN